MSKTSFGHFVTRLTFYARLGSPKVTVSHITPSVHVESSYIYGGTRAKKWFFKIGFPKIGFSIKKWFFKIGFPKIGFSIKKWIPAADFSGLSIKKWIPATDSNCLSFQYMASQSKNGFQLPLIQ